MALIEQAGAVNTHLVQTVEIAGVSAWGTVENLEHRHWRRMIDVNLMGPIHVIENFVPPMVKAGRGGALVNVSSATAPQSAVTAS
ncbi:hypothetical protein AWN90_38455 [Nocardia terpenica]|uniref:SDR family NAD(P)-dependent oxidoreductase n=1 Tax=Nocardia terpenica TaxID=455432 RepID=A0A164KYZ4_9NOCA|nr:hypothetical protein AWN90_38455 [Nocardia terpenica]